MDKNFMENLLKCLQERDNGYDYEILQLTKRNDEQKTSLCVRQKGKSIAVNLYMDDLERRYKSVHCDMEALVKGVFEMLKYNLVDSPFASSVVDKVNNIQDYEYVKDKIMFRVINREANKEYLKKNLYVPYLDLAISFYISLSDDEEIATVNISEDMANDWWKVSTDEIYRQAMINTPVLAPYKFERLDDILNAYIEKNPMYGLTNPIKEGSCSLWVLSNLKMVCGASCILYEGLMKKIAERLDSDIIIIPSSINETILLKPGNCDVKILKDMVLDVNRSVVEPMDRLSDNVYLYSRETDTITILEE